MYYWLVQCFFDIFQPFHFLKILTFASFGDINRTLNSPDWSNKFYKIKLSVGLWSSAVLFFRHSRKLCPNSSGFRNFQKNDGKINLKVARLHVKRDKIATVNQTNYGNLGLRCGSRPSSSTSFSILLHSASHA